LPLSAIGGNLWQQKHGKWFELAWFGIVALSGPTNIEE
jgi:hypothetical protein